MDMMQIKLSTHLIVEKVAANILMEILVMISTYLSPEIMCAINASRLFKNIRCESSIQLLQRNHAWSPPQPSVRMAACCVSLQ